MSTDKRANIDKRANQARREEILAYLARIKRPVTIKEFQEVLGDVKYGATAVFLHRMETKDKSIIRVEPKSEGYVLRHDYGTIMRYAIESMGFLPGVDREKLASVWKDGFYVGAGRKEGSSEDACKDAGVPPLLFPACDRLWRKGFMHGRSL